MSLCSHIGSRRGIYEYTFSRQECFLPQRTVSSTFTSMWRKNKHLNEHEEDRKGLLLEIMNKTATVWKLFPYLCELLRNRGVFLRLLILTCSWNICSFTLISPLPHLWPATHRSKTWLASLTSISYNTPMPTKVQTVLIRHWGFVSWHRFGCFWEIVSRISWSGPHTDLTAIPSIAGQA